MQKTSPKKVFSFSLTLEYSADSRPKNSTFKNPQRGKFSVNPQIRVALTTLKGGTAIIIIIIIGILITIIVVVEETIIGMIITENKVIIILNGCPNITIIIGLLIRINEIIEVVDSEI